MSNKHWYWIAGGVGLLAGFYLGGANSNSGIYANQITGTVAANLYNSGFSAGGGAVAG